jgi:UDP-N-acetylmuramate: L-alanyl-gamma-D-glutamyl-meso-diaminopimelate ligase
MSGNEQKMKLYFIGICGTAMGNAALLARAEGHEVAGADEGIYPPMSTVLERAGIAVEAGYDPARLERLAPDLVVVGNAISRGNPEVEWLLQSRQTAFTSLPAMLHDLVLRRRRNIVICGTHGKTTTTALTAFLLRENGGDPGFLIGGVPQDPPAGSHRGAASEPFVIEGDEYDSAFFDKRSKFIHYAPHIAVLNNLEFDHADIFRDLADVQRAFSHFSRIVPRNGYIVINGDDDNLTALGPMAWTRVLRVGLGEDNDARITDFAESPTGARFSLWWRGQRWGEVTWSLPGIFNARNAAMAAVAASLARLEDDAADWQIPKVGGLGGVELSSGQRIGLEGLARFRGVRRRQEIRLSLSGLMVMEDFGHHPTALRETLRSIRGRFPGARLAAVFEPRSNTARIRALQEDFRQALSEADDIYLGPVNRPEKLGEEERFDTAAVARALAGQGRQAADFSSTAELFDRLCEQTLPPAGFARAVVFFSNGSFDGIVERYIAAAQARSGQAHPPGLPIG